LTHFLDANRYPPRIKCGQAFDRNVMAYIASGGDGYRSDQRVDIAGIGAVIDDRGAYRELAIENRGRGNRDPGFLNIDDDIAVDLIGVSGAITETDDVELHRRQQLEPRLGQNPRFEIFGKRAGARDDGAELFRAVGFQREPGFQRAETARQIGAEIARPGRACRESPGLAAQIGRGCRKRFAVLLAVAHQQEAGIVRHLPPFVKIKRDRIRVFNSGQQRR
jgi:hypothetical protein